jgi:hypothetical protein
MTRSLFALVLTLGSLGVAAVVSAGDDDSAAQG